MPLIKSSSDLQRNFGAIASLAHETGEPIYITRNGESSLVVMDADAYDDARELADAVRDYELSVLDAYRRSDEEIAAGHTMSYEEYRSRRAASYVEAMAA